ncbi:MAG: T9SS type A sorting domain-containing protein [Bacteroidales bacterium]|jgi:hypothetical protein|nr:T9SS type A sorting domain-containing protein [Bacteroidales bacterium]
MNTKLNLIALVILLLFRQAAAGWEPYGPQGIQANRLCFWLDDYNHQAICHDEGICVYDPLTMSWTDYPAFLPVIDACYLDGENFLTILGCGTDSDGIYSFNPSDGIFELIDYLECPNFIAYDGTIQKYYIGHHLGLAFSYDGLDWQAEGMFNSRNMVDMAVYQNHLVVSEMDNLYGIWISGDHGFSWTAAQVGSPMISDLCFDAEGKLYGIFPDMSYSSGLWSSDDYGYSWKVEFWAVNMNCTGIHSWGDIYVGWGENPAGTDEGVARYDPEYGTLSFVNEGLGSLIINQICINPLEDIPLLYSCTEDGASITYDYVGLDHEPSNKGENYLSVFPNPGSGQVAIYYNLPDDHGRSALRLIQPDGKVIYQVKLDKGTGNLVLDLYQYPPGIYLLAMISGEYTCIKKLLLK